MVKVLLISPDSMSQMDIVLSLLALEYLDSSILEGNLCNQTCYQIHRQCYMFQHHTFLEFSMCRHNRTMFHCFVARIMFLHYLYTGIPLDME